MPNKLARVCTVESLGSKCINHNTAINHFHVHRCGAPIWLKSVCLLFCFLLMIIYIHVRQFCLFVCVFVSMCPQATILSFLVVHIQIDFLRINHYDCRGTKLKRRSGIQMFDAMIDTIKENITAPCSTKKMFSMASYHITVYTPIRMHHHLGIFA